MIDFINEHHVLSLATTYQDNPSSCSVFYAFIPEYNCFVFASESKSEHMHNIMHNENVAASIHDEVREVLLIKGLQMKGQVSRAGVEHEQFYVKTFPEAESLKKEVWTLKVHQLKYTNNKDIGFGQKEVWKY